MTEFRNAVRFAASALVCVVLAGCAAPTKAATPDGRASTQGAPDMTLRVWASSPEMRDEVLEGCRYWNVVGVSCVLVARREKADVRFELKEYPEGLSTQCVKSARALAHTNGTVEVDLALFKVGKVIDRKMLVATIAHEMGHELGIDHISLSCDKPDTRVYVDDDECGSYVPRPSTMPDGSSLCGPAIMNAPRTEDFPALTVNDIRGFKVRDPEWRKTDPPRVP